jgi:beta-glucosidase-like glycosyl hydrolase
MKKLLKSKRFWAAVAAAAAGVGLIVSGDQTGGIRAVVSAILQVVGQ